ncbi:holliday junction resolvase [Bacillus phage 1_ICo-2020]|uniref:Holliday junction resolvase n=1 Tax=Bacillus phage 1_ICo-2020 TaxID=2759272 RepID=A0A7G8AKF8_9CAUD|nr:holliday junction resolvase [Bacillus phage 1_ICo-2020]
MSKYGAKKVVHDGITFDSRVEGQYYLHLKELQAKGEVTRFDLQPKFTLLGGFTDNYGVKHLPVKYIADFLVYYKDRDPKVIDIKGAPLTPDFKIKRKMYASQFPLELVLIGYSKIDGGWRLYSDIQKARKERKKAKEAAKNGN